MNFFKFLTFNNFPLCKAASYFVSINLSNKCIFIYYDTLWYIYFNYDDELLF